MVNKTIIMLKASGIDTDSVISRLGGNEEIYLSICNKFILDKNFDQFQSAILINAWEAAGTYIHTLKGVAANLGFISLNLLCISLIEMINNENFTYLGSKNKELIEEYYKIISILK